MRTSNETLAQARERNVRDALAEDIGKSDWTSLLIDAPTHAQALLRVREQAVLCGTEWFDGCLHTLDPKALIDWHAHDGDELAADSVVCTIHAQARALLSAERAALNFLQLLSATATRARAFAKAIEGASPNPKGCVVLDTRKTIPGLRQAQKYAVRVGGGANQRMALWDGILIKENHITACGGITASLRAARALDAGVTIQIEVEDLQEFEEALNAGAENILLDNFSNEMMRQAVRINAGRALLEVSGGVSLQSICEIAATGVDRISVGSITKDIKAVDYSLRITARSGESMVG